MAEYKLEGVKWGASATFGTSGGVVTWSFVEFEYTDDEYDFYLVPAEFEAAIRDAFDRWEQVCDIDFVEVTDTGSGAGDIRVGWADFDGEGDTLAECSWFSDGDFITSAQIAFDTQEQWSNSPSVGEYLYPTAVHEIGHAIGFDHYDGSDSIMNTYAGPLDLTEGDIAGARYLYGRGSSGPDPEPEPEPDETDFLGTMADEKFDLHLSTLVLSIDGGGGDDFVWGGTSADTLRGGAGRDIVIGDKGDDLIYGSTTEDAAFDQPNQLLGGEGDDVVHGGNAADYINGEWGDDELSGHDGDDLIYGGSGLDIVSGGGGDDMLWAGSARNPDGGWFGGAINVSLDGVTGASVDENWTIAGEAQRFDDVDDELWGGAGNDTLFSNGGGDWLYGEGGIDTASYAEAAIGAVARLDAWWNNKGAASGDLYSRIENLTGSRKADKLVGNDYANTLTGGGGGDVLQGLGGRDVLVGDGGKDVLSGGKGSDRLFGGAGKDRLEGGVGADRLEGGDGADRFVFASVADSTRKKAGRDIVVDFSRAEGDRIDVSGIDARADRADDQRFDFIGGGAFSGRAGELRAQVTGSRTLVQSDVNGDGRADFAIEISGVIVLNDSDFVL